jgi:hypothetical protein
MVLIPWLIITQLIIIIVLVSRPRAASHSAAPWSITRS